MTVDTIRWSPLVTKGRIRRLYEQASLGIYDDELVDDVGLTLYLRCRDILIIHKAQTERAITCPQCLRNGNNQCISYSGWNDEVSCPSCNWQTTWYEYRKTFRRSQLNPGGAVAFFQEYLTAYNRANTAKSRMMAIDRLIHQFHYSLLAEPDRPTRSVSVNLIEGRLTDVVAFLNELSGLDLPAEMQQMHEEWLQKCDDLFKGYQK